MLLETILCKFRRICATGNALMLLETILCKFGQICVTGNALIQLGATLYKSGQICETGNALMPLETILCEHGQICTKGNGLVRLEPNLCNWLLAGTPFWIFPPKFEPECAEPFYVVMTHHTAKANLEKGSSWPPEAIPHGLWHIRGLVLTQPISSTPWTRPERSHSWVSPLRVDYKIRIPFLISCRYFTEKFNEICFFFSQTCNILGLYISAAHTL